MSVRRASAERCALAHRAAHDLQAPLGRILRFSEIVAEDAGDALDAQDRKALEIVSRSAREASALVDRLLGLELAAHRPLDRRPVDIAGVVDAALEALADDIARTGASVEIDVRGLIDADAELLSALVTELLSNALTFCKFDTSTNISISAAYTREEHPCRLRVVDTGTGFTPERRRHAVEPFEAGPRPDGSVGSGLGLALCRTICERHGWSLALDGDDGSARVEIGLH